MSLQCYNKGCLTKFDPDKNEDDSCTYHPGAPIFHEGYKSWSCCSKKTTDFTEFLNIKGCTKGKHNPEKPPEPEKPAPGNDEVVVSEGARPPTIAPRCEDSMTKLNVVTTASLQQMLERGDPSKKPQNVENAEESDVIAVGTSCLNNGCSKTYEGERTNTENCYFHPGTPIFHEGMKYWSCCERKTSDFDNFLQQSGCQKGKHVWVKERPVGKVTTDCRYDFHQTGPDVYLTLYAKATEPLDSYFEANATNVIIHLEFNFGNSVCDLNLPLWGKRLFFDLVNDQFRYKMSGKIPRPPNMRDMLYEYNWRIGYKCIALTAVVWAIGGTWVLYKKNRYDRFVEQIGDPEYKKFILDRTSLTPDKYTAFVKRMQDEMAEVKAKYQH